MTEESKQLIPLAELGIESPEQLSGELDVLTKTSDFLPQIRIYGSENKLVKAKKFPMGEFGLYHSSDNVDELGEGFDMVCIAARPRASIIDDTPVSFYDFKSESFQQVKTKALSKVDGHLVGFEFLVWIPAVNAFALFFMGSITLRRESPALKALIGKGASLKIILIEGKKYTWHGCKCFPCTAPLTLPDEADLKRELHKFKNPAASEVEVVKDGDGEERAR